jgi:hypothetical protein
MSTTLRTTPYVTNARRIVANTANHLDGVQVYLFGSSCFADEPYDIDLLFVYDQSTIMPNEAYAHFQPIIRELEQTSGIPVHPVVITLGEERDTNFIKRVKAILITVEAPAV